ncbi:drug resistance transporter, EmrB/QacA subfamily [Salinibacillus kushneri]|uniref:Drug resistance transporter, EmrB/QacA subfamily n=1 Tax=Salinibacillus kushneri TaxID=237682 RepID=A0A1I0F628_9BACI|nr:DHA2 family efflux MFS transporter permease subunit [Salinibacillus kushneri]SET53150.1 drug resistance transporter, EmrB/QacA subfamily [Salinibacillus kushneri]
MSENENQQTEQANTDYNKWVIMIVLLSGAFVAILNQTLLATALPKIAADLKLDYSVAQWLQSIFMLINGIMIPITAFLIGHFTTRRLFMSALGSFAIGTIICSIAPNFSILMVGRIFQAAAAGIIMPLMQTILFLTFPRNKRGTAMGMFGLVIAFAPAIGPTLSGWMVEHFPWRSLFYLILPIIVIDIFVAYFVLRNVTKRYFPKLDSLSILLSTFGFGGLLYGFSVAGGDKGWANTNVYISMAIGAIALTWFIVRQLKLEEPILEFRVFKYKIFTLTTILGMVVFLAMIGSMVILPLYMQDMLGFTAFESGLALLPGAATMGLMNPVTGRLFDKFGAKWLSIIGLTVLVVTTFMFTTLTVETTFTYIAVLNAVRMLGIAMVMMPVTTAGLNELPLDIISHGTAMNNTMRQVAGAVGTALMVTVMSNTVIPSEGLEGAVHGVNMSFIFAGVFAFIGLILTFFIKHRKPQSES